MQRRVSIAVMVMFLATLAACAVDPVTSTHSPGPTDAPATTPAAPSDEATVASGGTIEILAETLVVTPFEGPASTYSYFDDPSQLVIELEELFGTEPEKTVDEAETHFRRSDNFEWDGFFIRIFDGSSPPDSEYFNVYTLAASVSDVQIVAAGNVQVGDAEADVASIADTENLDTGGTERIQFFTLDETPVESNADGYPGEGATASVSVWITRPSTTVTRIGAPAFNFGA